MLHPPRRRNRNRGEEGHRDRDRAGRPGDVPHRRWRRLWRSGQAPERGGRTRYCGGRRDQTERVMIADDRKARLLETMKETGLDVLMVYGNAWQGDYLRYATDFGILEGQALALVR